MKQSKISEYFEQALYLVAAISFLYLLFFLLEGVNDTYFKLSNLKIGIFVFLASVISLWYKSIKTNQK